MNEFGRKKVTNVPNKVKAMKNLKKRINIKSGQNLWNLKTYNKLQSYWIGKNACSSVIFCQIECCYLHCMSLFILICSDESCEFAASLFIFCSQKFHSRIQKCSQTTRPGNLIQTYIFTVLMDWFTLFAILYLQRKTWR